MIKRIAARAIVAAFVTGVAGLLGAALRDDYELREPVRDIATGGGLLAVAELGRWAFAELELEGGGV